MKFPRKTKKIVSRVIAGHFPRRYSRVHRRFCRWCRIAGRLINERYPGV